MREVARGEGALREAPPSGVAPQATEAAAPTQGHLARMLPVMPLRYALVVFGGGLLLVAAQGADGVVGYVAYDWRALVVFAATLGGLACLLLAASGPNPQPLPTGVGRGEWAAFGGE